MLEKKIKCKYCGKKTPASLEYCQNCGGNIAVVQPTDRPSAVPLYCPICHSFANENADDEVSFCINCGNDFRTNPPITEAQFGNPTTRGGHEGIYCPVCGQKTSPEDKFCIICSCDFNEHPRVDFPPTPNHTAPSVVFCSQCKTNIVSRSGELCESCKRKQQSLYRCVKCRKNPVEHEGDICDSCKRYRERVLKETGNAAFEPVTGI